MLRIRTTNTAGQRVTRMDVSSEGDTNVRDSTGTARATVSSTGGVAVKDTDGLKERVKLSATD
eukprot:4329537-Prymnesium_polylepis.1